MSGLTRKPSATALKRIQAVYTPQVVAQLAQIEQDLGGRSALIAMLVMAPLTADLQYVLGMLGDPLNHQKSLAEICGLGNILPGDLLRHLTAAAMLKGKVLSAQKIAQGMPAVVEDIMRRAAVYRDVCHHCVGTGTQVPEPTKEVPNPLPEPCPTCRGIGQLEYRPDLERQKLAVELSHLLPKSGGIQIAQIQTHPGGGDGQGGKNLGVNTFDAVQRVVDQVLYGPGGGFAPEEGEVLADAEVVDPPEKEPPDV